jgi:hypothetical protein
LDAALDNTYIALGYRSSRHAINQFSGALYILHSSTMALFGCPVEDMFDRDRVEHHLRRLNLMSGGELLRGYCPEDRVISEVIGRASIERVFYKTSEEPGGFTRSDYRRNDWQLYSCVEYGSRHLLGDRSQAEQTDVIACKMLNDIANFTALN